MVVLTNVSVILNSKLILYIRNIVNQNIILKDTNNAEKKKKDGKKNIAVEEQKTRQINKISVKKNSPKMNTEIIAEQSQAKKKKE